MMKHVVGSVVSLYMSVVQCRWCIFDQGYMAKDLALKSNMRLVTELQRYQAPQATQRPPHDAASKRQRADEQQWQQPPAWWDTGG
jgi:hypothetical protein